MAWILSRKPKRPLTNPSGLALSPDRRRGPSGRYSLGWHFVGTREGSTAVEFAIVAFPFFALLLGIIELGMIFLISTTLENATNDTARRIRTGELQTAGGASAATFANSICANLTWLGSQCQSKLRVDVRTFAQFKDISAPQPIVAGKLQPQTALPFQMGGPGDIILVRAYYPWALIAPMLDGAVQKLSGGQTLISATATFRNEPYPTTP